MFVVTLFIHLKSLFLKKLENNFRTVTNIVEKTFLENIKFLTLKKCLHKIEGQKNQTSAMDYSSVFLESPTVFIESLLFFWLNIEYTNLDVADTQSCLRYDSGPQFVGYICLSPNNGCRIV